MLLKILMKNINQTIMQVITSVTNNSNNITTLLSINNSYLTSIQLIYLDSRNPNLQIIQILLWFYK